MRRQGSRTGTCQVYSFFFCECPLVSRLWLALPLVGGKRALFFRYVFPHKFSSFLFLRPLSPTAARLVRFFFFSLPFLILWSVIAVSPCGLCFFRKLSPPGFCKSKSWRGILVQVMHLFLRLNAIAAQRDSDGMDFSFGLLFHRLFSTIGAFDRPSLCAAVA